MSITNIFQLKKESFKRVLRAKDLFAIGYGDLGSSIYYALGIVALFSLGATPISLALAGCVFLFTALTYAELASLFPEAGGSANFARYAFNDSISFLAGWGLLLDYVVTIAISSFAIAPYLQFFFGHFRHSDPNYLVWHTTFTLGIIFVLYLLNVRGVKLSTRTSFFLTLFTLVTQLAIVVISLFFVFHFKDFIAHLRIGGPDGAWSPTFSQFIEGTAMAMVAYTGIDSISQLSSETKQPGTTIPRVVFALIFTLLFSYFCISMSALSVLTPNELGTTFMDDPISGIVSGLPFGASVLGPWVGILAAILLLVAANAGLIGSSRLTFYMSEHYQLPRFLFFLHPRFRTPYVTLGLIALLAAILVLASQGKMMFLADLYNFGAMIAFFTANLSLIILRIKRPDLPRPFKAPFNITIKGYSISISSVIGMLATFAVWLLIIFTKEEGRLVGLIWMAIGGVLYFSYRRKKKINAFTQVHIENIEIPGYTPLAIKKILIPTRGEAYTENVQIGCELAKHHKAEVLAIHIMEIPLSLPIHDDLPERRVVAERALKRAEAIAREYNVEMKVESIRARSIDKAILELMTREPFDLIILGAPRESSILGPTVEQILRESKVRIWICRN